MTDSKDIIYMRRALQLALLGRGNVSPNPMVGAVIVADGRIIGEGYHRRFGGPHAEVNAVRSVADADRPLLQKATIYVTLEPCSHYGKTPPCARLLIEEKIPRVVIGALDPFEKVSGRGACMLREAGAEVVTGVLKEECEAVNVRFMTAHRLHRPFIELKWAQTSDGFIGLRDFAGYSRPLHISDPLTSVLMHADRACADAVMVGTETVLSDDPRLTLRRWPGHNPLRVTFDRQHRIPATAHLFDDEHYAVLDADLPLANNMHKLYSEHNVTSLIVEGGVRLLESFLRENLWDRIRVETSETLTAGRGVPAPQLPADAHLDSQISLHNHTIEVYTHGQKYR